MYRTLKLGLVIDKHNGEVEKHIGEIADCMNEWEGRIAESLGLNRAEVARIKIKYPWDLQLQT